MAPVNSIEITDGDRATFQFFRKRRNMTNDTHDADYWDLRRRWQLISSNIIQMPRERGQRLSGAYDYHLCATLDEISADPNLLD